MVETVTLPMLWLPILVSAVLVFIASMIFWMALPFWHGKDYGQLPNEKLVLDGLANAKPGQYMVPFCDWKTMTPEQRDEVQKGPGALMYLRNPWDFSMALALIGYFVYILIVAIFVAYVTGRTHGVGTHYLEIFRIAGAVGFIAFAFRGVADSIWYGKPWKVTLKEVVDGLIFGLLMAGSFGWLWPR